MIIINNIYIGNIRDTYIGNAIEDLADLLTSTFQYASLLCVDSDRDIESIVKNYGISELFLLNPNKLFQCNISVFHKLYFEYNLNINFSSVLYTQDILIEAVPNVLKFTSEIQFSDVKISENEKYHKKVREIANELTKLDHVLALGDGCGLNYATDLKMIAEQIEKMKQP